VAKKKRMPKEGGATRFKTHTPAEIDDYWLNLLERNSIAVAEQLGLRYEPGHLRRKLDAMSPDEREATMETLRDLAAWQWFEAFAAHHRIPTIPLVRRPNRLLHGKELPAGEQKKLLDLLPLLEPSALDKLIADDNADRLWQAMQVLDAQTRALLLMANGLNPEAESIPLSELARYLGVTKQTLSKTLQRASARVNREIARQAEEYRAI
jgi:hypothetical protein